MLAYLRAPQCGHLPAPQRALPALTGGRATHRGTAHAPRTRPRGGLAVRTLHAAAACRDSPYAHTTRAYDRPARLEAGADSAPGGVATRGFCSEPQLAKLL